MDYSKIYQQLILRAQNRVLEGYNESHHIVPKCMGGTDEPLNLVDLTPEEHFLAHMLLVKIYPAHKSLIYAVQKMCIPTAGRPKRKMYGWLKRRFSEYMSETRRGSGNTQYGMMWITDGSINKKIPKDEDIPSGWQKGRFIPSKEYPNTKCKTCGIDTGGRRRIFCQEHFSEHRISIGFKGANRTNSKKVYSGKYFVTNGIVDKTIPVGAIIPEGYWKGRSTNNRNKGR